MKPMLAHVYEPHRITWPCHIQPKFNGIRALYQAGRFQSRDELPWNPTVLDHLAKPLQRVFGSEVVLDGELYVHGWSLQRINGAVQIARTAPREDTHEVRYVIFDRVDFNTSFEERFKIVQDAMRGYLTLPFFPALTHKVYSEVEVNAFYTKCVSEGFEGIMYRLGECPYTTPKQQRIQCHTPRTQFLSDKDNRVHHMLKRKAWQDDEFTCVDIEEGVGKRSGMVGAFICQLKGKDYINAGWNYGRERFRVGSGITDEEALHYFNNPGAAIGHKIKVKFLTLTERGVPFNPTIEAIL